MSWIREKREKSLVHRFCTHVLRMGEVPKHIAFIMDGNRRFAKKKSVDRAQGHTMGFDTLSQTLEWCLDLGIEEVTVYAFSIENFKRSKDEVDCLMSLAREKLGRIFDERETLHKYGICIRILGNITLLPEDIQRCIADAMLLTKDNNRAVLNVCFSYTSQDEICAGMKECIEGVQLGIIHDSDISERVLEKCFYTNRSTPPDVLVRTSGEVRLSDFLLWQSSFSLLSFVEVLWPEFSMWQLYAIVLHYQHHHANLKKGYDDYHAAVKEKELQADRDIVKQTLLEKCQDVDEQLVEAERQKYTTAREERIQNLVNHVETKRQTYLQSLCCTVSS